MPTILNPYLSFNGNARDAMEFYQSVFGGNLTLDTFQSFHVSQDPSEDHKIMHAMLQGANGITLMGADVVNGMEYRQGSNFSISLSGENHAELKGYYEKLSAGGQIVEPLEKAPWGDTFGMLVDRFGVHWMVNIAGQRAG